MLIVASAASIIKWAGGRNSVWRKFADSNHIRIAVVFFHVRDFGSDLIARAGSRDKEREILRLGDAMTMKRQAFHIAFNTFSYFI